MPRQIVHVSYQDPDHLLGGQGWAVYNLAKAQVRNGGLVYWISPCIKYEQPGEFLYENGSLKVIKLKFTDEFVSSLFANGAEIHRLRVKFGDLAVDFIKHFFDPSECVVHLHGFIETPRRSSELRAAGYPAISTFHMLLSSRNQAMGTGDGVFLEQQRLECLAIEANSIITVPSSGMKEEILKIAPEFNGIVECVRNGIGDEFFSLPITPSAAGENVFLSYGRISPEKGYDLVIEAAGEIQDLSRNRIFVDYKFIIFGNTDFSIQARKVYADNLLSQSQKYKNISFLASETGILGAEKIRIIDRCTLAIIPSLYEPFGMVIPEIMARGKPVITTMTSGSKDIMQSNKFGKNDFGFIVKPKSGAIAEAIVWMLDHPDESRKMGENAFIRAREFNWNSVAYEFDQLYWNRG